MKYTLNEQIVVDRPIADCFAYLKDFATIEQWDPGVYRSRKLTPGAPKVGTEYEILLKLPAGKQATMHYTQIAIDEPNQLILNGVGDQFSALDTLSFKAINANSTMIDYRAELDLGWLKPSFAWTVAPFLNRLGRKAIDGLKDALTPQSRPSDRSIRASISDRLILPAALNFGERGYLSQSRKAHSARMDGKIVAITGPTAGLGLATACELARLGATLLLIGRNEQKLNTAAKEIQDFSGCSQDALQIISADLSSLSATAAAAKQILQEHKHLDVLINNAGALFGEREETEEGFERALAVNFLAPVLLCKLLQPTFENNSRIINVVSGGLYFQGLNIEDLQFRNENYDGSKAYARAKRALLYLSRDFAETATGCYHTMHPGWAATPGVAKSLPAFNKTLQNYMRDSRMGADTIVWLASAPELDCYTAPQLWFDRRPHTSDVIPGTKPTPAELQWLKSWTTSTLAQYE